MNGCFELMVYNIDRGLSAWFSTPTGANIMFDLGRSYSFSPLLDVYSRGVRTLDAVFVTHPHADHFNDISMLGRFHVSRLFRLTVLPSQVNYSQQWRYARANEYAQLVSSYQAHHSVHPYEMSNMGCNNGSYSTPDGLVVETFQPAGSFADVNDMSLVAVVSFNGVKIILSGDNGPRSWQSLLLDSRFRSAIVGTRVLLAPHHGRMSGYSVDLMSALGQLDACLVSDGRAVLTNAVSAYDQWCRGVTAVVRGNTQYARKCLTTRNDGHIRLFSQPGVSPWGEYSIRTF